MNILQDKKANFFNKNYKGKRFGDFPGNLWLRIRLPMHGTWFSPYSVRFHMSPGN